MSREVAERAGLLREYAMCIRDGREAELTEHTVEELGK